MLYISGKWPFILALCSFSLHVCSGVHIFMWVVSFSDSLRWGITDGCENLKPASKARLSGGIIALRCAGGQLQSFSTDILICVFQECNSWWSGHQRGSEGGQGRKGVAGDPGDPWRSPAGKSGGNDMPGHSVSSLLLLFSKTLSFYPPSHESVCRRGVLKAVPQLKLPSSLH